jgi:hypothetical protein
MTRRSQTRENCGWNSALLLKTGDGGGMASFGAEFDRHFEAT